jgi:hypothetical protein
MLFESKQCSYEINSILGEIKEQHVFKKCSIYSYLRVD